MKMHQDGPQYGLLPVELRRLAGLPGHKLGKIIAYITKKPKKIARQNELQSQDDSM